MDVSNSQDVRRVWTYIDFKIKMGLITVITLIFKSITSTVGYFT